MTEPPDRSKSQLRTRMRSALAAMPEQARREASRDACRRLCDLGVFGRSTVVMLYMPLADEVDVTPVAERCFQMHKTVCVPRVDWHRRDMEAVSVPALDDRALETGRHGLRTPRRGAAVEPSTLDLVLVPGLAFDRAGSRLGRGGGYYDRFLGRLDPSVTTVGVGFEVQLVERVPTGDGDVAVGMIVTDQRVCRAGGPH